MSNRPDRGIRRFRFPLARLAFPILGLSSFLWFLARVIPKPSRATYPCMRVAAPLASSFIAYLLGIGASVGLFRNARRRLAERRYVLTGLLVLGGLLAGLWVSLRPDNAADAWAWTRVRAESAWRVATIDPGIGTARSDPRPPNEPIGEAQGIHPGRVVWVWDPDATNENCTNSHNGDGVPNEQDDGWFLVKNNDQGVIDRMLSAAVRNLTGESTVASAWDALFADFNRRRHGLAGTGYTPGEKIFIKVNATSTWGIGQPWGNITNNFDIVENGSYGIAETSPQLVLSTMRELVYACGVAEQDISVGDPMKYIYNHCYNLWSAEFPDVHYVANTGGGGREGVVAGVDPIIFYSDHGTVLPVTSDRVYTVLEEADYIINIPAMKAHARAGITLFAKNHFGSHTRVDASHLHPGLVAPDGVHPTRTNYGMYRVQVDLMGHDRIGRNTVLFLLDGLWAGSEAVDPPTKWDMPPFDGDWTSSVFASQDPVAIESVAFDFLSTEYDGTGGKVNYPNMGAVDDYLHQAADSTGWPAGIVYDPEGDGTPIPSLGVHEHWNNLYDKKYSRNLGTGDGIELIAIEDLPDIGWDEREPVMLR